MTAAYVKDTIKAIKYKGDKKNVQSIKQARKKNQAAEYQGLLKKLLAIIKQNDDFFPFS